jgi:WD40 repeat protein
MQKERLLLSASADGLIRFWDLNDLSVENPRVYTMNAFNYSFEEDQLTSVTIAREHVFVKKYEKSSDRILTGCTGGKIKCWDISRTNFRTDKDPAETMRISWYIQAHRKTAGSISSLQVVENYKSDRFIISASTDNNILLHRISSGVKIG